MWVAPQDIFRERDVPPTSTTNLTTPAPEEEDEEEDLLQLLRWARRRSLYPPHAATPSAPEEEDQKNKQQEPARSRRRFPHPRGTLTPLGPNEERELHSRPTSNPLAQDGGKDQDKLTNHAPYQKRRRHRSPSPRRASKIPATKDNGQERLVAGRVSKRRGLGGKEEENGNNESLGGRSRRGVGEKEGESGNNENQGGPSHHHRKHHGVPPSLPANRRTWCLRCARYLAISPQFTCEFAENANKCTRCARWQDECVPVSLTFPLAPLRCVTLSF